MIKDKFFQKGFIVVEICAIILFALVTFPFAYFNLEFWKEMDSLGIWLIQIFFAILTIIFLVVGIKLCLIKENKLRFVHIGLDVVVLLTFLAELSFCIRIMSQVAQLA